jgi:DNA/RNA-binding domain of Phe-tRNA-synthetase-like protein
VNKERKGRVLLNVDLQLPLRVAVIEVRDVTVSKSEVAFRELEARAQQYHRDHAALGQTSPGGVPGVQDARRLFRSVGMDPTKTRPSSEALLRRALKQKPLHQVNSLVDVGNWCSLDFLLPLGLYDLAKMEGDIRIRRGGDNEEYEGIGSRTIHVGDRYTLADDKGPFGSPVADSLRTAIQLSTTRTIMIILAPVDYDAQLLSEYAETAARRIQKVCGGQVERVETLAAEGA